MRRQVGRVLGAVAIVGALISGCGGAGQPGTAAVIGEESIPIERIQSSLDVLAAKPEVMQQLEAQGLALGDYARFLVRSEITHALVARKAAEVGVAVTEAQVDAEIETLGGVEQILASQPFDLSTLRQIVRDGLLAGQLAEREAPGLAVTVDMVGATTKDDADRKAKLLAAGGPEADGLFSGPAAARDQVIRVADAADKVPSVILGAPVGSVVTYRPSPDQAGYTVVRITGRTTDPAADPAELSALSTSTKAEIGTRLAQFGNDPVEVSVNPRYGAWDPVALSVVPEDQVLGEIITPGAAAG